MEKRRMKKCHGERRDKKLIGSNMRPGHGRLMTTKRKEEKRKCKGMLE